MSRDGNGPQLFILDLAEGGEARITQMPNGLVAFEWASNTQVLATAKCVLPAQGMTETVASSKHPPQVITRMPYKTDGIGYTVGRQIHLFSIDVETGEHRQLTDGAFNVRSFGLSRDGSRIAYARTREGRLAHRTDIWISGTDGSDARQLSRDVASTQYPVFSGDGKFVAFIGSPGEGEARTQVWLADLQADKIKPLGDADLEAVPALPRWRDYDSLAFIHANRGRQHVSCIDVHSGEVKTLVGGDRHVSTFDLSASGIAFSAADAAHAPEIYIAANDGGNERRVTSFNAWWEERTPLRAEMLSFEVPDGGDGTETIEGWLIRAEKTTGATPLLVDAHGGPQSYALLDHAAHAYWPVLAARGWSILALNPVGSSSYGKCFADRLLGNWGRGDLKQYIAAVQSLQQQGKADTRVAITGKSYGGYLAAWAIGQTEMFKAAVVSAPVSNLESHMGTSDSGYYVSPYSLGADPEDVRRRYHELSPIEHLDNAKTPTLILQGEDDQRCPLGQSEELFSTLMRVSRCEPVLVIYPGADHQLASSGKPSLREDYHSRIVDWLVRWCEGQ